MNLSDFILESNRIESIFEGDFDMALELEAYETFLASETVKILNLEIFVSVIAPAHRLRRHPGMDVMVGIYVAPKGGEMVEERLDHILTLANDGIIGPFDIHCRYEELHPFTDCNGRSGRLLWLWMMGGSSRRLFLHEFYYQTLRSLASD